MRRLHFKDEQKALSVVDILESNWYSADIKPSDFPGRPFNVEIPDVERLSFRIFGMTQANSLVNLLTSENYMVDTEVTWKPAPEIGIKHFTLTAYLIYDNKEAADESIQHS